MRTPGRDTAQTERAHSVKTLSTPHRDGRLVSRRCIKRRQGQESVAHHSWIEPVTSRCLWSVARTIVSLCRRELCCMDGRRSHCKHTNTVLREQCQMNMSPPLCAESRIMDSVHSECSFRRGVRKDCVLSAFRVYTSSPKSEASVLMDRTTKSAKKLMIEPPATVGLGLCSAATPGVSHDSLFTAVELSAWEMFLIRPAKELNCKVTDFGAHVKRVLTRPMAKWRNTS